MRNINPSRFTNSVFSFFVLFENVQQLFSSRVELISVDHVLSFVKDSDEQSALTVIVYGELGETRRLR